MRQHKSEVFSWRDAVKVAHVVDRCRAFGPGERFVLWVEGCSPQCSGCHSSDLPSSVDCEWTLIEDLEHRILVTGGLEGLTVTGCEPFVQARALGVLAQRVRRAGLSVMVHSNFMVEQLVSGVVPYAQWLLYSADLVMEGRYRQDLPTAKPWRGSDNQRLLALSSRYASQVEAWNQPLGRDFEIRVQADRTLEVLGIPPAGWKDDSSGTGSSAGQQPGRRNTRKGNSQ